MRYCLVWRANSALRGFVNSHRRIVSAAVSTNWLQDNIKNPEVRILHATWDETSKDYRNLPKSTAE